MKAFDADPSLRWLFLFTHPDDEVTLCAWIRRLASSGVTVWLAYTHSIEVREREGRAAAQVLGVPEDRLSFLGFPDAKLIEHLPSLALAVSRLTAEVQPSRIVTCAFEQGHLDHDATNWAAAQAFSGPIFETPLYHTYLRKIPAMNRFVGAGEPESLPISEEERQLKQQIADLHASQALGKVLRLASALPRVGPNKDLGRVELLRRQVHTDFRTPNLPPRLRQRVEASRPWGRWLAALDAADHSTMSTLRNSTSQPSA